MEKTFRVKVRSSASDWAGVLEQELIHRITERLATKREWQVAQVVEADEAGWVASTREGQTNYVLSLTVPARAANSPPPPVIEWKLVATVFHDDTGQLRLPLGAIMFGMGGVFAALGVYLRLPFYWVFVAGVLGVVPVGLLLGIMVLRPLAARRGRGPVPDGDALLEEMSVAVNQLGLET